MSKSSLPNFDVTEKIIGYAYEVHNDLGFGFLEAVYRNSLALLLHEGGLTAESEKLIVVYFRGQPVGNYVADLLVENSVIVELKSVQQLAKPHEVQLVNYLQATGIDVGLLINFGPSGVEVKRKIRYLKKT